MSNYWMTTRHYKPKPSMIRMEHIWRHTLRRGRTALAYWTVTDLSPGMVADWRHIYNHEDNLIRVIIEADRNRIEVSDLVATDSQSQVEPPEIRPNDPKRKANT